jgi:hypothetical protein
MDHKYTVPIILNSVASTVEYEGGMGDGTTRIIVWDLTFTAKSFIWPPVKTGKIINSANTNINLDTASRDIQKVYVDYANGNNVYTTGETLRDTANGFFGTVEYFSNTSVGTLVIADSNKLIETGYVLTGDYSGARYTVETLDISPVKLVSVVTEPNPNTALPNSNFGYTETVVEWPDTLL